MTGSAHNKSGLLKKNDPETLEVLLHLEEKIRHRRDGLALVKRDFQTEADTLVISFGITARAMKDAVGIARREGRHVSSMNILTLFPVPEKQIIRAAERVSKVVIAEENMSGQYRSVLAPLLPGKKIIGVNKIGSMITPHEILDAL